MRFTSQTPEYTNFFEEIPTAEVAVPTAEAVSEVSINSEVATPEAPAESETPITEERQIPQSRFDKVYAEAKDSQRKLEELQKTVEELQIKNQPAPILEEDLPLDADAEKAIRQLMKREGLFETKAEVSKLREELSLKEAQIALNSDTKELSSWAKDSGYPEFKLDALQEYAKDNGLAITNKTALKSAYLAQNMDAIISAAAKRGVVSATETPKATVEKPGAATGKAPSPADSGPKTTQERIREAMANLQI